MMIRDRGQKRAIMAATLGMVLFAPMLRAETAPVVVELYTAQGCVACPPADVVFSELAETPGVIALSLHVDYWDYLGWEDGFASPANTERQKAYAHAVSARMIYTPQVIVGGVERVQGTRQAEIAAAIAGHAGAARQVSLTVLRDEAGQFTIDARAEPPLARPAMVQLVRYTPSATVNIEHGENAGREVTYHNIVTDWALLGEWTGKAALQIEVPLAGDAPAVVIVQEQGPGRILAAATLD